MERFHAAHPDAALQINVTRWPYSFIGADRSGRSSLAGSADGAGLKETWHDALLGYMGNDPVKRDGAERSMAAQGMAAGIKFDYNVLAQWQPVDSQRLLLWAGRFGLQEEFIGAMNRRHFELAQSASDRATLMAAAAEVGLDTAAATTFLDSDELEDHVWRGCRYSRFGQRKAGLCPWRHKQAWAHPLDRRPLRASSTQLSDSGVGG
jgi:hypothetical protein